MIVWMGMTLKIIHIQHPSLDQGNLSLEQVAQDPITSGPLIYSFLGVLATHYKKFGT